MSSAVRATHQNMRSASARKPAVEYDPRTSTRSAHSSNRAWTSFACTSRSAPGAAGVALNTGYPEKISSSAIGSFPSSCPLQRLYRRPGCGPPLPHAVGDARSPVVGAGEDQARMGVEGPLDPLDALGMSHLVLRETFGPAVDRAGDVPGPCAHQPGDLARRSLDESVVVIVRRGVSGRPSHEGAHDGPVGEGWCRAT